MKPSGTISARIALTAFLLLWIALSFVPRSRPAPEPANAPPTGFSAARAIDQVRAIAQRPHPTGTPEHDRVRDYLVAEIARQGLSPQIQAGFIEFNRRGFHTGANVQNIIARLPGTANTRPVMLTAHYDSVPRGPGAGDDAHGVAVLLETLRALKAGPPLRNDVIFLITDGEERYLLGAMLFMRDHPWRGQPGVTLNFEARGTAGSAVMFETSENNAWLLNNLRAAVPQADATSVSYEIYKRMPNDTDLTVFKSGNLSGMNFAFIEHPDYYHTAQDSVDHLDPVSVQEQGRYALHLARRFGNLDLTGHPSGNAVYFPTAFTPLIVYSVTLAKAFAIVTALVAIAAAWFGGWIGVIEWLLSLLGVWVAVAVPGLSYLVSWPLAGAVAAVLLLSTAPPVIGLGGRLIAIAVCALPAFLLPIPLLHELIVALGIHRAGPILAVSAILTLIFLLPQLTFLLRPGRPS